MSTISTVLLVHGAWADGHSWAKVIPLLGERGFRAVAVQLPLTSLPDDAAAVRRAIALEDGPLLLVGHSYGGAVISEAGDDPKVAGLVYAAAFAPDVGESAVSLGNTVPPAPMAREVRPDAGGFLKLTRAGVFDGFAQDLPEAEREILLATQGPTSVNALAGTATAAAWKSRPSHYVIASADRAIPPQLQQTMATRAKSRVSEIDTSHVVMLAAPRLVVDVIADAAARAAE